MSIPFENSFASHTRSNYWSDKNIKKPRDVRNFSHSKYWFDCECGHNFESVLSSITKGGWCGFCCNPPKKLCNNDCEKCYKKSFASHEKSIFWSSKNGNIKPREVFLFSNKDYLFDCLECGHEFTIEISKISERSQWCSYCSHQKLCEKNDCNMCLKNSFASHEKSIFWSSKNGNIKPRDVFKGSDKQKYIFDCECGHEFETTLNSITSGCWCHYCSHSKLCEKNDCKKCFEKSFASHEKSIFWSSKNGNIKPRDVFKNTRDNYIFDCKFGHEFECALYSISGNGSWCPSCKNKTEVKLFEKIQISYASIRRQFKQKWCKNITYLPFDFYILEYKIIIELDGLQHFKQVSNWKSPEEHFERDKYKEKCANDNGYSTIRIIQEDVWNDKYDWCKELCETIEIIKSRNEVVNIYLCKNGEYDKFI